MTYRGRAMMAASLFAVLWILMARRLLTVPDKEPTVLGLEALREHHLTARPVFPGQASSPQQVGYKAGEVIGLEETIPAYADDSVATLADAAVNATADRERRKILINLGLPKTGTTSLNDALKDAGFQADHYNCLRTRSTNSKRLAKEYKIRLDYATGPLDTACVSAGVCATLMKFGSELEKDPLAFLQRESNTGWRAWTQIDCPSSGWFLFPQVTMLEEFFEQYSQATFTLTTRSTKSWLKSIQRYLTMAHRIDRHLKGNTIAGCAFPSQDSPAIRLSNFKDWHEDRVRLLAKRYRVRLIELDLENKEKLLENFHALLTEHLELPIPDHLKMSYTASNPTSDLRLARARGDPRGRG